MPKVHSNPQRTRLSGYGLQMSLMFQPKIVFLNWGLSLVGGKDGLGVN